MVLQKDQNKKTLKFKIEKKITSEKEYEEALLIWP